MVYLIFFKVCHNGCNGELILFDCGTFLTMFLHSLSYNLKNFNSVK